MWFHCRSRSSGRECCRGRAGLIRRIGSSDRNTKHAWMLTIVEELYVNGSRVLHRFLGHNPAAVEVPLSVNGVHRADHQSKPATPFQDPRGESKPIEVVG